MAGLSGIWYLPPAVSCLRVDRATRAELCDMSRGRAMLIDYFACAGWRGWRFGDVRLGWLDDGASLPDRMVLLDDIDEPLTLIRSQLVQLMRIERARLTIAGLRVPRFLRRPAIAIEDGGPWLDFFAAHATPLGLRW